jgi:hypothetical protein
MCSNYFLETTEAKIASHFGIEDPEELGKTDVFPGYAGSVLVNWT